MTWSIPARNDDGTLGVAIAIRFFAFGGRCVRARRGTPFVEPCRVYALSLPQRFQPFLACLPGHPSGVTDRAEIEARIEAVHVTRAAPVRPAR